jgi:hypothetical protein
LNAQPDTAENSGEASKNDQPAALEPNLESARLGSKPYAPETEAKATEPHQEKKHWLEYATAAFALFAAVGGIVAAIFTGWQASIANNSLAVNRDQERRSLRAYLFAHPIFPISIKNFGAGQAASISVAISMMGITPAYKATGWTTAQIRNYPYGDSGNMDNLGAPNVSSSAIISPDSPMIATANLTNASDEDYQNARAGTIFRVYVWGRVDYFDIFARPHWLTFCYNYSGDSITDPANNPPEICTHHNDVDSEPQNQ